MSYGVVPLDWIKPAELYGPPDHPQWRWALVEFKTMDERARRLVGVSGYPRKPPTAFVRVLAVMEASSAGIKAEDLFLRRRQRKFTYPRYRVFRRLRSYNYSLTGIAREFAMDHTTILSGLRRIEIVDGRVCP